MRPSVSTCLGLILLAACASSSAPRRDSAAAPMTGVRDADFPSPDSAAVVHLLNRLAFGPRPGDIARVQRMGMAAWVEQQLAPTRTADPVEAEVRRAYETAFLSPAEQYRRFPPPNLAQRAARQQPGDSGEMGPPPPVRPRDRRPDDPMMDSGPGADSMMLRQLARGRRELAGDVQMATLARHVLSERQLLEVMSDFWFNHFNVFLGKQAARWTTADYVERAIRPNALGRFADLLEATATHPAMLVYLDNAQSVRPGARPALPPNLMGRRPGAPRGRPVDEAREMQQLREVFERMPTGINENYARELLELHTLGVDGGYTQADVQNVARILTGWSIAGPGRVGARLGTDPNRILTFEYRDWAHDREEKVVLGRTFPAGGGIEEGRELLRMLAAHPATARHISHKLCARFVADSPPDGCVDAAVVAWRRSDGDIREVVRAIVRSEDFWAPTNRRAKVKSPLEFVVSALRATLARPDTTARLSVVLQQLGQPLFLQQVPTGYPETSEEWVNSGALLARMNVAMGFASGRMPGLAGNLDSIVPPERDLDALIARINAVILGGQASPNTLRVLREQVADARDPRQARTMAVAFALGSPDFQKQ